MILFNVFDAIQLMIQLYLQQYLTMSQTFKIRKNKSQKEIIVSRRSPLLGTHQFPKQKGSNQHYQSKLLQLQPLLTTKASISKHTDKLQQYKLDYTQPVPPKSHSLTNQETKSEPFHLMPIENNLPMKHQINDKQNRPPNQHEIKYPAIAKINSTMLKTDKNRSMTRLTHLTEGLQNFRSEKDIEAQACKRSLGQKKMNLLKTSSRTKLAKIFRAKPSYQENDIVNQVQDDERPNSGYNSANKKELAYKLITHHNNPISERAIIQDKVPQAQKYATLQNQAQQPYNSPNNIKNTNEHWGNCSTIRQLRQQEESCSSFITGQAIEDFMFPKQTFEPVPFLEEKFHYERRIKVQTDRIKKKFPQNFFK